MSGFSCCYLKVNSRLFKTLAWCFFVVLMCFFSCSLQARIQIESHNSWLAIINAVKANLQGPGVEISNIKIVKAAYDDDDSYSQVGTFSNGTENYTPNIGISKGLVISTGKAGTLGYYNKDKLGTAFIKFGRDPDLAKLFDGEVWQHDPVIITFEIKPKSNNISIDFVFGSDEYGGWLENLGNIDAYGFFISGPDIQGGFANRAVNLATLDNGDPVSTKYVNQDKNSEYYIDNGDHRGKHVAMRGVTKVINRSIPVIPGEWYQVKIALGERGIGVYDSSVFIGQFKSERLFSGRLFHHRLGSVNEDRLAEGDEKAFDYFSNARVVLFDAHKNKMETKTGPRGEYRFIVKDQGRYQIAVDAATLKAAHDVNVYYPEQTWSSRGGRCIGKNYSDVTLTTAGYCYGGKTGGLSDELKNQNTPESAEHLIEVPAGLHDYNRLNFGFSFDVVTQPGDTGQGSLRQFIANANAGVGTGEMLFVPTVHPNNGTTWKTDLQTSLPAIKRSQLIINGRAFSLTNPEERVNPDPQKIKDGLKAGAEQKSLPFWQAPDLHLETKVSQEAILQLQGSGQKVQHIALTNGSGNTGNMNGIIASSACNEGCSVVNTVIGKNPVGAPSPKAFYRGIDAPYINHVRQENGVLIVEGFAMPKVKLEFYSVINGEYRYLFERIEGTNDDKDNGRATYIDPVQGSKLITQEQFQFTIPNMPLTGSLAAIVIDDHGNTSEFSVGTTGSVPGSIKTDIWQDQNRDGERQANETGFQGIHVRLTKLDKVSGMPVLQREDKTDANRLLTFADVLPGNYQVEVLPDQPGLKDWQPGAKGNPVELTVAASQKSPAMFGYVLGTPELTLTPDYQRAVAPGLATRFTHTFFSSMVGNARLSYQWLDSSGRPLTLNWSVQLFEADCDQAVKDNIQLSQPIRLEAGQNICFDASVFVPAETPSGFRATLEITAQFTKAPAGIMAEHGQEEKITRRIRDTITVTTGSSGRLVLNKQVQNMSESTGPSTANQASPGDMLRYTLFFSNPGAGPIQSLSLRDSTPPFTSLASEVQCPEALRETCKVRTIDGKETYQGYRGDIIWSFSEKLAPGASGSASYDVIIE